MYTRFAGLITASVLNRSRLSLALHLPPRLVFCTRRAGHKASTVAHDKVEKKCPAKAGETECTGPVSVARLSLLLPTTKPIALFPQFKAVLNKFKSVIHLHMVGRHLRCGPKGIRFMSRERSVDATGKTALEFEALLYTSLSSPWELKRHTSTYCR